eukprot:5405247-Prymnesium_polylepis.2
MAPRASSRVAGMLEESPSVEPVAARTSAQGGPSGASAERCCSHARRSSTLRQPSSVTLPTPK